MKPPTKKHSSSSTNAGQAPASEPPAAPWWQRDWFFGLILSALIAVAYLPAWNGQPIWDDDGHITKPELQSLAGLKRIWIEPGATQQYYPLTHTAFWIAHRIWDDAPAGYHLFSLLLHGLSAYLLLRIFRRLEIPGAKLAAALWALHPVQVESVAWISEIKNTLSGVFFLSSALAYLRFDKDAPDHRQWQVYATAWVLFLLGLLSKTVVAVLPAALLVLSWWKRGRIGVKRDLLPLMPFFVFGSAAAAVTSWVERRFIGAQGAEFDLSVIERVLIAGRAFWFYLGKLVWPHHLTFIYPRWRLAPEIWWQCLFPLAALALLVALWLRRRTSRWPLATGLLFVIPIAPALGFVNIYPFCYSFVADHFQYLAGIAPLALVAAGSAAGIQKLKGPKVRLPQLAGCTLSGLLCVLTWCQSTMYSDMATLWQTTIDRNPTCWMAYTNMGQLFLARNQLDKSIDYFSRALQIHPNDYVAHNNLATVLNLKGMQTEAMAHMREALKIKPDYSAAYNNLGMVLQETGDVDSALIHYRKALALKPDLPDTHYNIGMALLQKGQAEAAIAEFEQVLQSKADDAETTFELGNALLRRGRIPEALTRFERVLALNPNNVQNLNTLAWILATCRQDSLRNGSKALALAQRALQMTGGADPVALQTLSAALAETGQYDEALTAASQALNFATDPNLAEMLKRDIYLFQIHRSLRMP